MHGVLCIDAVEVSTNGGHVIALDMEASPYPLGGEAGAVIEDVIRLGGMPIVAHPDSPKSELAWTDTDSPIAGIEWLNLDSAWRSASKLRLSRLAFDALIRPGPAVARLLDRPVQSLARWDALATRRRVVGVAATTRMAVWAARRRAACGRFPARRPTRRVLPPSARALSWTSHSTARRLPMRARFWALCVAAASSPPSTALRRRRSSTFTRRWTAPNCEWGRSVRSIPVLCFLLGRRSRLGAPLFCCGTEWRYRARGQASCSFAHARLAPTAWNSALREVAFPGS